MNKVIKVSVANTTYNGLHEFQLNFVCVCLCMCVQQIQIETKFNKETQFLKTEQQERIESEKETNSSRYRLLVDDKRDATGNGKEDKRRWSRNTKKSTTGVCEDRQMRFDCAFDCCDKCAFSTPPPILFYSQQSFVSACGTSNRQQLCILFIQQIHAKPEIQRCDRFSRFLCLYREGFFGRFCKGFLEVL